MKRLPDAVRTLIGHRTVAALAAAICVMACLVLTGIAARSTTTPARSAVVAGLTCRAGQAA